MKKILFPIALSLILGFLCANYVFALYEEENLKKSVYFLQAGAYEKEESSYEDYQNLSNKLLIEEDNKYYLYIGITTSKQIAEKIKEIYKEKNIEIYIKNTYIDNNDFVLELEQYDILLENSKTFDEINNIFKTVLASYEEEVLNK